MLNVNVLPLKVVTATVSAYMLTLTFSTATLSFNVLPLTLKVNVWTLKVATLTVSSYMLTLTFATVLTVANTKLSVYVLPLTVLTTTLSFSVLTRF